ncbi:patatin-like phospholipase family protein [Paenibacillus caseinilyticus]|uniref:patatin-like phospholipase family protein n=1 Tax=Paenibacillus mucilaginosus TaxID=61624 RepID=UPI0030C70CDB
MQRGFSYKGREKMQADAVFEGGGVKGIAFIGALQVMELNGYKWERLAGTSAGSIIAALLAAGYRSSEILKLMQSLEYRDLLGRTWMNEVPVLGNVLPIVSKSGIYVNNILEKKLEQWLGHKNIRTFGDLTPGKLSIIASNVSNGKMVVLPEDLHLYGLQASSFPIALAVRMSTSLPFFYQPYLWQTPAHPKPHYMLDGGLLSNYPIWLFDVEGTPRWPTFGFRLSEKRTYAPHQPIRGPLSLFKGMFRTMLQAHDQRHVDSHAENRTIFIPTGNVTTTKFDLTEEDKEFLLHSGTQAALSFLEGWNFERYKVRFRESSVFSSEGPRQEQDEGFLYH